VHHHLRAAFIFSLTLFALCACTSGSRFLLYFDPYSADLLKGRGIEERQIKGMFPQDIKVKLEIAESGSTEDQALQDFIAVAERFRPDYVYLTPAHAFTPTQISAGFPDTQVFREDHPGAVTGDQILLVYDREQANHEAGAIVAQLLRDPDFLNRLGGGDRTRQSPQIGILVAVSNDKVEREITRFVEGFSRFGDPARIQRKDVGNITDRVKARRLLDAMREQEVAIVLLKTYVLSGFCLDYMSKEGGLAVVEEPIADRAYGDTVLLMLEDDFLGALEGMIAYINQDLQPQAESVLYAPVHLRWGEAYRLLAAKFGKGVGEQ
jgi:hypothetical protein